MQGEEYVVFLLKNYRRIKSEIDFLKNRASGKVDFYPQLTGLFGMVIVSAKDRMDALSPAELNRAADILAQEIADLE